MKFSIMLCYAIYFALGYVFAHVTFNKTEEAFQEGRIITPRWARFGLSLAVIIIWPTVPVALTARYLTQHWRKHGI